MRYCILLLKFTRKAMTCCGGAPDGMVVNRLQDEITRGVKPALLAILGAVLAGAGDRVRECDESAACAGTRRRSEFAMRTALGAGRARLIRQLLAESLLLAAIGGMAGMAIAEMGVRALVALSPAGLPRVGAIRVDGAVFAFGLGITTLVGLAGGAGAGATGVTRRSA